MSGLWLLILVSLACAQSFPTERGNSRQSVTRAVGKNGRSIVKSGGAGAERALANPRQLWKESLRTLRTVNGIVDHFPFLLKLIGIRRSDDIIRKIRSFRRWIIPLEPSEQREFALAMDLMVRLLKEPRIKLFVDNTIEDLPQLSPLVHDIQRFFEGPNAKPVYEVYEKLYPPFLLAMKLLSEQVTEAMKEIEQSIALSERNHRKRSSAGQRKRGV